LILYSVTELNLQARELLEGHFGNLSVEGEISNLAQPRSGHLYFSLKDAQSQVRCAMFRMHNRRLGFLPENGMQVQVRGRVSLYPERGDFQLIVQAMEAAGAGALRRAFEDLKAKLAAEGLFEPANKRPLPALAQRIGVITSPTGAAIRDVLSVLKRRFAHIPVLIYPVPVQGAEAAGAISQMIDLAARRNECDVLILTRGGGSLEDLWAFNEEIVARAIVRCPLPLVSAIGHEVDFSIADFVADQRAATPSAAAELVSPDAREWRQRRDNALRRLQLLMNGRLREDRQSLAWLLRRLRHPSRHILLLRERHNTLSKRLRRAQAEHLARRRQRLSELLLRLRGNDPRTLLNARQQQAKELLARLQRTMQQFVSTRRQTLQAHIRTLETVSPQATLDRGYAIVTMAKTNQLIQSAQQIHLGDQLNTRLARGRFVSTVDAIKGSAAE